MMTSRSSIRCSCVRLIVCKNGAERRTRRASEGRADERKTRSRAGQWSLVSGQSRLIKHQSLPQRLNCLQCVGLRAWTSSAPASCMTAQPRVHRRDSGALCILAASERRRLAAFTRSQSEWPDGLNYLSLSFRLWIPRVRGQLHGVLRLNSILHVLQVEPQVLHVVHDDVDPFFPLLFSVLLSTNVYLQNALETVIFFSPLYMPKPSQPGLPYLVRDTPKMQRISSSYFLYLYRHANCSHSVCGLCSLFRRAISICFTLQNLLIKRQTNSDQYTDPNLTLTITVF